MLVGAVHGYRGLIRELIEEVRAELRVDDLPVVATGGYAKLMARGLPMINAVMPALTLEGLRILWEETFRKG
jgi:type III pantothenate kinase